MATVRHQAATLIEEQTRATGHGNRRTEWDRKGLKKLDAIGADAYVEASQMHLGVP